jgi:hypothetical protein
MKGSLAWVASSAMLLGTAAAASAQVFPESVYPPPEPSLLDDPRAQPTGFRFDLSVSYLTDYVWRGIERFDADRGEDRPNVQYDAHIAFDLGKLPRPYVGLFVNTADDDPVSDFQEVRPEVGFDWNVRPLTISGGYTNYIFPDRDGLDTSEVFLKLALDDSVLFRAERPVFSPYVLGAYDIDEFQGLYIEAGIRHTLPIENTGLSFTVHADVAYVNSTDLFSEDGTDDSGFQHWEVGLNTKLTLNQMLNIPDRFGQISLFGKIYYTDGIESGLRSTSQIWGGAGISLEF